MIPVVEMLRVSTQGQAGEDRAGIPAQRSANVRTCALFGLEVVESIEIVESGVDVATSPQMARILETITVGRVRGIVLAEYSRLFRPDRWSDLIVLQTLSDYGAQIYLPSGPIDLQSEPGFVQATVNNLLAGMERKRIRDRMMRGKEEHRKRGAHMGGGVGLPTGLSWSKVEGWSYNADIERVRGLFRAFLAGDHCYDRIGQRFGFARSSARFVLSNPIYSGWRVYDEKRDLTAAGKIPGTRDRRKIARDAHEVIRVRLPLEPIVSEEDFASVQQIISGIHRRHVRTTHVDAFAYRGHLVCRECGRGIYCNANRNAGDWIHNYLCPNSSSSRRRPDAPHCPTGFMRRGKLEPFLDDEIRAHLTDRRFLLDAIDAYLESRYADWRSAQPDADRVSGQVRELSSRRARVIDLFVDGTITKAERDARLLPIDRELGAMQRLLAMPEPEMPAADVTAAVVSIAKTFQRWKTMARAGKLEILDNLAAQIHIGRYEIEGIRLAASACGVSRSKTADHVDIYLPFRVA